MKKTIDEATARKLCAGCVYRKDLNPRCMKCFVNVLGQWRALAREAYPTTGSAGGPPFPAELAREDGESGRREA